jgi:hypothetical protein
MGWKPDHKRMKPVRVRQANAAEQRHWQRILEDGCLVCGMPAEIHHVVSDGYQRLLRDNRYVAPLCPAHHRLTARDPSGIKLSVEELGHLGFYQEYGIDLWAYAQREWLRSEERRAA